VQLEILDEWGVRMIHDLVVLFDIDNTLVDNDRVQADMRDYLTVNYGPATRDRYFQIIDELQASLSYVDYLGALERYRLEDLHDPRILRFANWLLDYPFADRLYPGALEAVHHASRFGRTVVLSDGDAVFQPRKVELSGLWRVFNDNVLIFVHKEQELANVERFYPARHYVLIDDKLRILVEVKRVWGDRVTTIFARQGHYATDIKAISALPVADVTIECIGDLVNIDLSTY
jgi:hypothetical protein